MRAVVEALAFAELSGDDILQPDAAVRHLEEMASILRELSAPDRVGFVQYVERLAAGECGECSPERAEFLRSLARHIGLVEE